MPQWEVVLIATLVGALLGIMARQWLMKVIDNRRNIGAADETAAQVEMRRVLYLDLSRIFQRIDDAMNGGTLRVPNQFWIQQEQLKRDIKFDGETYLKGHQDIFMQLPERRAVEGLYELYHLILDESAADSVVHQWVVVNGVLANLVKRELRYIKKFLGNAEAEELIKKLKLRGIYEEPKDHRK